MPAQFPNESAEYRRARNALLQAEKDLRQQTEEVAALRRKLPEGGALREDYAFRSLTGASMSLSSLFGTHDTLAIYSLMYGPKATEPCPMCSAFLDGLNGQVAHLSRQMSVAVVAQNTPKALESLSARMGWGDLPLYSTQGCSYQADYLAETENGDQLPMLNLFRRGPGGITHFWGSEMFFEPSPWHPRHIDTLWPLWNMLDLTPQGRGEFMPTLR